MLNIINQIFEIEKKSKDHGISVFDRNIDRLYHEFSEIGYVVENPMGKIYDERDSSLEVNLVGNSGNPRITKVMKPIVFEKNGDQLTLIQKGIVIAE